MDLKEHEETMHETLKALCRRLEYAQAAQNEAVTHALAGSHPASGARCTRIKGGYVLWLGPGHMLNQAIALGLEEPLLEEDLASLEAELGQGGHPVTLELTPGAEGTLPGLLARRGYRIQAFQQVWQRALDLPWESTQAEVMEIRPIMPLEAHTFAQVVTAGFLGQESVDPTAAASFLPATAALGTVCFMAFREGVPAAGGTVAIGGEVAVLSGASVLPQFRGKGLQRALIAARLDLAKAQGCTLATSTTLPGTVSQANLERLGFRVAYPKLELVK